MADAAEVQPLPDEEPIDETPQSDDSSEADQPGKDVSFGTFLTVGPKATRNVTIIGYDSLRDSVRAVRRSGDTVENIQIPYEQYKTLLDAQRESDLASGRKTKKNLSKAVSGYFGKSVALDGKSAQVIGYDAQSDEVLVSDAEGPRWMKSGEMLRSTQNLSRNPLATPSTSRARSRSASKEPRIIQDQGGEIDQDKTAQIQRAFEQGRITIQDPPGQRTVSLSVDTDGKVLRQLETTLSSIQPSQIEYVSSSGQSIALTDVDVAIPAVTAPLNVEATIETTATIPSSSQTSIRATREALQQSRAASGAIAQGAVAAVAAVAATIPATNTGATAAIAAAQNVLATYANSAANRQNQIQELSNQISDVSNRINELQQRSRQSLAGGDGGQAAVYEQQMVQAQSERRSLLDQQTDIQVTAINENNKAALIVKAVEELVPDKSGEIPEAKVLAVQRLLPRLPSVAPRTQQGGAAAASAALPTPPRVAPPRAYAPGIPTRPTASAANPAIRSPKPLRPLGGSLSTLGGQARRAADFNADQAYDRGAGQQAYEDSTLSDSSEEALATEGGLAPFSGPLDTPQAQTQTYAAGADDEEDEPADIYGAREEEGRSRMSEINQSLSTEPRQTERFDSGIENRPSSESATISTPAERPRPPVGPSQQEIARAAALQQATAQAIQRQGQQQQNQKNGQIAADQAESQKQKIQTAKKTFSNLVDAFDTVHGAADVVGILLTVAHLNIRLILTVFKRDLPFTPRAGYPYECGVILCFDILVCLAVLSAIMGVIIFIASVTGAVSSVSFGLSELIDLF